MPCGPAEPPIKPPSPQRKPQARVVSLKGCEDGVAPIAPSLSAKLPGGSTRPRSRDQEP
jgi:hypothetical protein